MTWRGVVTTSLVAAVAGGVFTWAGFRVFSQEPPPAQSSFTTVAVGRGVVESAIELNTRAQWTPVDVLPNASAGTVTSVDVDSDAQSESGDVLYTVDLRPTVLARGATPSFRDLDGGERGFDVVQLQDLLRSTGYLDGDSDGAFGSGTRAAVDVWQRSLGIEPGLVRAGDVIYLDGVLPTRVQVDPAVIRRGARVSGGEPAVAVLGQEPSFVVPVTDAQAALLPEGTDILITSPEGSQWSAAVVDATYLPEQRETLLALGGGDSGICGAECGQIPLGEATLLPSRAVLVSPTEGLKVPVAALVTLADGAAAVIDESGRSWPVRVLASAGGQAVIESADGTPGIREGMLLRLPASEASPAQSSKR